MPLMETIRPFGPNSNPGTVDVLGVNPLVDWVRVAHDSNPYEGEPPTFWRSGNDLPFVASGEAPRVLRKIRFELRHTAALTESRSHLLALVEASAPGALLSDPEQLMSPEGREAYAYYRQRVFAWATAGPETKVSYTDEDFDRLFGPKIEDVHAR